VITIADEIVLSDIEKDALMESANIGAGNASSSLSKIVKKRVNIVISDLNFVSLEKIQQIIGGPTEMIVGVFTPVGGDMTGTMTIILPIDAALGLASILQRKNKSVSKILAPPDQKALKEMGDILFKSYLGSLCSFLDMDMLYEESKIVSTFGESVVDFIMLKTEEDSKNGLMIKTDFSVAETDVAGKFVLLLTVKKMDKVLKKIKEKIE
jgi:chemotaxis protein CheC